MRNARWFANHFASLRNDGKTDYFGVKDGSSVIFAIFCPLGYVAKEEVTAIKREIALLPFSKANQKIFVALRFFLGQPARPLYLAPTRFCAPKLRLIER